MDPKPAVDYDFEADWGKPLEAVVCEQCDWNYLVPRGTIPQHCPHCYQGKLASLEGSLEGLPYVRPPELVTPFTVSPGELAAKIQDFGRDIPFAPPDLTPENLQKRLRRVYLPVWLVDACAKAEWQAEAGFDYEVVSHQERFHENSSGWKTQEVKERRVRWEPRLGRLEREYSNVVAPALEEHARLQKALGEFDSAGAQPYQAEQSSLEKAGENIFIRLPNRPPEDAWGDAEPVVQAAAAEECRQAAKADHIRQFRWRPEWVSRNWTLMLQPLYTTFYIDDEGAPQRVLIHGQTGQIVGKRRASIKAAQRWSTYIGGAAIFFFLLSLVVGLVSLALPPALIAAGIGLVLALALGLGALVPLAWVSIFNRNAAKYSDY